MRVGIVRGTVLGAVVLPFTAGVLVSIGEAVSDASWGLGPMVLVVGSVVGLVAGPVYGLVVGLVAALMDRRASVRWPRRRVAVAAIVQSVVVAVLVAVVIEWVSGSSGAVPSASFWAGVPGLLGIVSLWVVPLERVEPGSDPRPTSSYQRVQVPAR